MSASEPTRCEESQDPQDSQLPLILLDGPSGSGKTTLAHHLAREGGYRVVSMDDFYPGWGGLARGSRMVVDEVILEGGYMPWDWEHNSPDYARGWVDLLPWKPTIVEGVGAVTLESLVAAYTHFPQFGVIMLDSPASIRKQRALKRDPDYAPWWNCWAVQELYHFGKLKGWPMRMQR